MQVIQTLQPILQLIQKADSETLLLLDIDETLLTGGDGYGGERWYDDRIRKSIHDGMTPDDAVLEANAAWEAAQPDLPVSITEPIVLKILETAKLRKVFTMGLTARRPETCALTSRQLASLGINLRPTEWRHDDFSITIHARHVAGILYGGPLVEKGLLLGTLLDVSKKLPKQIIFADDKAHHALQVKAQCQSRGIIAHCFQYLRQRDCT